MKQMYIRVILLLFITPVQQAFSQCTCSDGSSPDSVVYNQQYDSIISTNTAMSFPKFSDTIGLLTCLRLSDTVTTVVNYNLENNLDTTEDYNFETYRRSQFTGPDGFFSSVLSPPKDYGPYTLGPYDPVGHTDEVNVGPDTVFNNNAHTQYFGGSSSYYGSGNVTLNYLTTSTFTILTGSDNAIIKLQAYTRLAAQLVYYWCPFSVLQTNLSTFEVSMKDNNVVINWKVTDHQPTNKYEIEMSNDGKNFTDLGAGISTVSGTGTNSQFVYSPESNFSGDLYFRIKQTDASGRVYYSEIRSIYINNSQKQKLSLYPNPTVSGVSIRFVNNTGSEYKVELFNSYGQLIFLKNYSLSKAASINIAWPDKPAPGIYFIKVTDINHHGEQVERLKIL
jgi:hypothetical protein